VASTLLWFRRDLRLDDNPALLAAAGDGTVVPLFVLDPALWGPAGTARKVWLVRALTALRAATGGALVVRHGDPSAVVPEVAAATGAGAVHCAADFGVYGRRRDAEVEQSLERRRVPLVRTGSPYAVAPGTLSTASGEGFQVFTPFSRAWLAHGWPSPAGRADDVRWTRARDDDGIPAEPAPHALDIPDVGEAAAQARWRTFRDGALAGYGAGRNRPSADATSALSAHLKYGELHPRTLLADIASVSGESAQRYRLELCWREFYADVLWHRPDSARHDLRPALASMSYDSGPLADERFAAWAAGRTGFPFVDAGMRQLLATGWIHNRARMVVASFLVKHLHLPWQRGARHFMAHLRDGDIASNAHGWQWVAGTGTDPAPYFRIFNPLTQGHEHDPEGEYVRRWVPELRTVAGAAVHEPWRLPGGLPKGYPERIVDHAAERAEALRRYEAARAA
jgi:deoxyribodipyrimidine photo-lyase